MDKKEIIKYLFLFIGILLCTYTSIDFLNAVKDSGMELFMVVLLITLLISLRKWNTRNFVITLFMSYGILQLYMQVLNIGATRVSSFLFLITMVLLIERRKNGTDTKVHIRE